MNANELAEIQAFKTEELTMWERNTTATMLRQQQAEIEALKSELDRAVELYTDKAIENEALKQIIDANNLNQNIGQFVKPTNEPVAWMYNYENFPDSFVVCRARKSDQDIPLYTHPVKELDEQFEKGFKAGKEEGWKAHKFHHPVKEQDTECQYCKQGCIRCDARKQLTDEEIEEFEHLIAKAFDFSTQIKVVGLDRIIRAILRKAQKK